MTSLTEIQKKDRNLSRNSLVYGASLHVNNFIFLFYFFMKRTLLLVAVSSSILVSCSLFPSRDRIRSDIDMGDMMREHCREMPGMRGCEEYADGKRINGARDYGMMMMDHSAMVTSEEAFVVNMIPHHQEAVDTARLVVAKGENVELKKLAQDIITAQEREIAMMQKWSKDWNYSTVKPDYQNMMGDGTKLSGKELDRWFLMGMIMHHMGALQMADAVLELSPAPRKEVIDFAHDVITAQTREIKQMRTMLGMGGGMMTR